jgi:hypothetical protein
MACFATGRSDITAGTFETVFERTRVATKRGAALRDGLRRRRGRPRKGRHVPRLAAANENQTMRTATPSLLPRISKSSRLAVTTVAPCLREVKAMSASF